MKRFIPSLLSVALACASLESMAAADLIITNAKVFTGEPGQALQQAVAVEDGKILQVGSNAAINALADGKTQRIDLAGKVLMPGMIDTHSHPIMGAMASLRANLYDEVLALDELERWILEQDQAGTARMGDLIVISGVSSAYWEQSAGLGNIFNRGRWREQPLVLDGIDGHTGWANQAMLKRLKIDAELVRGLSDKDVSPQAQAAGDPRDVLDALERAGEIGGGAPILVAAYYAESTGSPAERDAVLADVGRVVGAWSRAGG